MVKLLIFLSFFTLPALATSFRVQPLENQIKEADGMFEGNFLKKKTIQLEDGRLATQMIFKMSKEVGLQSDFFGMDEVIVHYPGGTLNGQTVSVEGVPEFVSGEKVVLFIRSVDNRYWGLNLGFGSFKVINYGKQVMLVNTLFPHHPEVGQMNFQHFEKLVKDIKGENLKVVQVQYPTTEQEQVINRMPASEGQNRAIASKSEELDNEEDRPSLNVFWLIAMLGLSGGIFRMANRKAHK